MKPGVTPKARYIGKQRGLRAYLRYLRAYLKPPPRVLRPSAPPRRAARVVSPGGDQRCLVEMSVDESTRAREPTTAVDVHNWRADAEEDGRVVCDEHAHGVASFVCADLNLEGA